MSLAGITDAINNATFRATWGMLDGWRRLAENRTAQRVLSAWLAVTVTLLLCTGSLYLVRDRYALGHNVSDSLPQSFFWIVKSEPVQKGDYVAFKYHNQGAGDPFPDGVTFTKFVQATAGATIATSGRDVYVDGRYAGHAKPHSKTGVPLELIAPQVIPPGQLYVLGTHRDSYDSRYARVGLIKQNDVIGKAIPLF